MTEFAYVFNPVLSNTLTKPVSINEYDFICLDAAGLTPKAVTGLVETAELKLIKDSEIGGVMIVFYEDTLSFMRHLWLHSKLDKTASAKKNLKLSHVLHVGSGPNRQISGGGVNGSLFSSFQRVAAVFFTAPDKLLMNPSGEKNTTIEAVTNVTPLDGSGRCISGEIFARLCYRFKYDGWRSVYIGGFGRFFLHEFIKNEPKKPSERFKFTVFVGESDIKAISSARMMCAAEEIGTNFDDCPSPKEVQQIIKEMSLGL